MRALLVTRGAGGMDLFESGEHARDRLRRTHIPVLQRHEVFDVTGAGDTVAAVMGISRQLVRHIEARALWKLKRAALFGPISNPTSSWGSS